MSPGPVKVLYIMGWTRSGSTLLDNLAGELDGFFSTGELRSLWKRALAKHRQCGCGKALVDCEVWRTIIGKAFGDVDEHIQEAPEIARGQFETVRLRNLRRLLRYRPGAKWRELDAYLTSLSGLYRAIQETTNASVIVNSSKMPQEAAALRLVQGVDPYVVHLVRDPRAVAYSMRRRVTLEKSTAGEVKMPRSSALKSALGWLHVNLAAEWVKRSYGAERSMVVRYEEITDDPRSVLEAITGLVGEPASGLEISADGRTIALSGNHTVWGNSARFKTGKTEIRRDDEWARSMGRWQRLVVGMVSAPLLSRYGYTFTSGA